MTTTRAELRPLQFTPGTNKNRTALSTNQFTDSDRVRYVNGFPEKIGGWRSYTFDGNASIEGCPRSIFSLVIGSLVKTLIGTNEKLYALIGTALTNITPFDVTPVAIADSLDTHYAALANNPITTVNDSQDLVVADTEAAKFIAGDTYTLAGAATTRGVPNTEINAPHTVRAVGVNSITIRVSTAATSSGTGGGAGVNRTSGLLTVHDTAHGLANGARVSLAAAANTGGIVAATHINKEHIIRNVATDAFDIMTLGTASSSVAPGGGASTTYLAGIEEGECDEIAGFGYGAGRYGTGLYGTSRTSATGRIYPRVWFFDRFGEIVIATPGNQGGLYEWDGDISNAPVLVSGAPAAINYAFVSDNILVTLGASGVKNRVKTSDINDREEWTLSSTLQTFQDDIEGAGRFISHLNVRGTNLLFTEEGQVYTMVYRGGAIRWDIHPLSDKHGPVSAMARCEANGIGWWMGNKNFHMWRGGNVEIIPSNTEAWSTVRNYVYNDINWSQKSKFFAWFNEEFQEVWFHYCSSGSNEPDRVARVNIQDFTWSIEKNFDRSAAEYPKQLLNQPRLISSDAEEVILYQHEVGKDDDEVAMAFTLTGPYMQSGKNTGQVVAVIPDSTQTGDINVNITGKQFPQSTADMFVKNLTVTPTEERIPAELASKYWKYTFSGSVLGQEWAMGQWAEEVQINGRN